MTLAATDFVEPGSWVWVRGAPEDAVIDGRAKGGVVLEVVEHLDADTGELSRGYRLARAEGRRVRWMYLREAEVGDVQLPSPSTLRYLLRAMATELGQRKAAAMTSDDEALADGIQRLLAILIPARVARR